MGGSLITEIILLRRLAGHLDDQRFVVLVVVEARFPKFAQPSLLASPQKRVVDVVVAVLGLQGPGTAC